MCQVGKYSTLDVMKKKKTKTEEILHWNIPKMYWIRDMALIEIFGGGNDQKMGFFDKSK